MDAQRKETIINEIKYWKKSHLLPNHYCDYLLALYTEGEAETEEIESTNQRENVLTIVFMLLNLLLAPSVALIILATGINTVFSIILLVLALISCLGISYIGSKIFLIDSNYIRLALLLNVMNLSLIVVNQWVTHTVIGLMIVLMQLILWIGLGIKFSNKLLIVTGSLGLILGIIMFVI